MPDVVTANMPSIDFDRTEAFYAKLGFKRDYRDEGWMILSCDAMVIEFFPHPGLDPKESWFSACIRTDNADRFTAMWSPLKLPSEGIPRFIPPKDDASGLRIAFLVDVDGSLLRIISTP